MLTEVCLGGWYLYSVCLSLDVMLPRYSTLNICNFDHEFQKKNIQINIVKFMFLDSLYLEGVLFEKSLHPK